ncbi:MAG: hypothetical protein M0R46_16170 [Candidatus Muirbacterium halophilum]|nr:hypothetical protein [Candidatus Muirbacterium halophilum]MCK9477453.1 hypothetical protein [Candidatus Muirbacterium halophilum]
MKIRFCLLICLLTLFTIANTGCGKKPSKPMLSTTPKDAVLFNDTQERELIIKDEKPLLKTKPVVDINSKPELEEY